MKFTLTIMSEIAEIIAAVAIVVSLIFVGIQVQDNTRALNRQYALDTADVLNTPFLTNSQLANIISKIKAVDGEMEGVKALRERYKLSNEEAHIWYRHQLQLFLILEANYLYGGETESLNNLMKNLLSSEDDKLFIDVVINLGILSSDFISYIQEVRQNL